MPNLPHLVTLGSCPVGGLLCMAVAGFFALHLTRKEFIIMNSGTNPQRQNPKKPGNAQAPNRQPGRRIGWPAKWRERRPLIWLATLSLVLLGVVGGMYASDGLFYSTQREAHTEGFPVAFPVTEAPVVTLGKLDVWLDIKPDMVGFVAEPRSGCVPSAYKRMLLNLTGTLMDVVPTTGLRWHGFYGNELMTIREADVSESAVYAPQTSAVKESQGLLGVLATLTGDTPAVIFTDLNAIYSSESREELSTLLQSLFDRGISLRVDRYLSAFGGKLAEYAASQQSVIYGMDSSEKIPQVELTGADYYHHLPRPFFVLTLAPAAVCEEIAQTLKDYYLETASQFEKLTCGANHSVDIYRNATSYSFTIRQVGALAYLNEAQTGGVVLAEASEGVRAESQGAKDVQGYTVERSLIDAGKIALTFRVTPAIAGLDSGFAIQWTQSPTLSLNLITENHETAFDEAESERYLQARGNRYVRLSSNALPNPEEMGVTATLEEEPSGACTVVITLDKRKINKGLYRVMIDLSAKPDVSANRAAVTYDVTGESIIPAEMQNVLRLVAKGTKLASNSFVRTLDLAVLMNTFRSAFEASENERTMATAEIIFDLRVR